MQTYIITPDENGFNEEKFKTTECYKHIIAMLSHSVMKEYPLLITVDVACGNE